MNALKRIWPTWGALADSLSIPHPTANSWGQRGIPASRYAEIMAAARSRGADLSFDDLEAVNADIRALRSAA